MTMHQKLSVSWAAAAQTSVPPSERCQENGANLSAQTTGISGPFYRTALGTRRSRCNDCSKRLDQPKKVAQWNVAANGTNEMFPYYKDSKAAGKEFCERCIKIRKTKAKRVRRRNTKIGANKRRYGYASYRIRSIRMRGKGQYR